MKFSVQAIRLAAAAFVVSGGLIVASCSGGTVNTTPVAQATNAPASTQAIPSAGGTLSVPASSTGQVATFNFGAGGPAGVSLTASSSAAAPGGAPAPSAAQRKAQAISGAVPFLYVTFSVSGSLSTQFVTGETVTLLSSFPSQASYYIEFDDVTSSPGTKLGCAGPGTAVNLVATIANGTTGGACTNAGSNSAPTLSAGHTYLAQFYYVPSSGAASPTPAASPTSSASPSASASPTALPSAQATSTASMTSAGGTLTLPSFGGYSGTVNYGAFTGGTTVPVALSFANYLYAGGQTGMPIASPAPSTIYAVVNIQNMAPTSAVTFTTQDHITLTIPTLAGVNLVIARYYEWQTGSPASALCVFTDGTTALTVVPTNGTITLPSPLISKMVTCTPPSGAEQSISPFFPMDNAIIEITNS